MLQYGLAAYLLLIIPLIEDKPNLDFTECMQVLSI